MVFKVYPKDLYGENDRICKAIINSGLADEDNKTEENNRIIVDEMILSENESLIMSLHLYTTSKEAYLKIIQLILSMEPNIRFEIYFYEKGEFDVCASIIANFGNAGSEKLYLSLHLNSNKEAKETMKFFAKNLSNIKRIKNGIYHG